MSPAQAADKAAAAGHTARSLPRSLAISRLIATAGRHGQILLVLVAAALLVGEAGRWHWFADLFAHFRWQGVAGLVVATLLLALGRRWRWVLLGLGAMALAGLTAVSREDGVDQQGPTRLRVASVNVHLASTDPAALLAWLETIDADVLLIQELTPAYAASLTELERRYPLHRLLPREDAFGMGLWSRAADSQSDTLYLDGPLGPLPALRLRLVADGQPLALYGIHPPPPLGATLAAAQAAQFDQLLALIGADSTPAALIGDFNATPWGEQFRRLRQAGLSDHGHAHWPPSWRPPLPWTLLALPIDQALVQSPWRVSARLCGPPIDSDHCPLLIELSLTP